jgi:formamidopyrimidine-DNA glycosylase
MPELPEVETVRLGLEKLIHGFRVQEVMVYDFRSIRKNIGGETAFRNELVGSKLTQFERRGKLLWIPIGQERCLVTHLGMSGQVLVRNLHQPRDKCERLRIYVRKQSTALELRFVDQRLFGGMFLDYLVKSYFSGSVPKSALHIAPDPLERVFDLETVVSLIRRRSAGIKSLLLNQQILSGIGNIYADEALWLSQVHFLRPGKSLTTHKIRTVLHNAKKILANAVVHGGTSFDEQYKNVNGESGKFSHALNAYGKAGSPCSRCGTAIKRVAWSNRGSYFCPRCQGLEL